MRTGDSVFSVKAARAGLPDRRPHFSHTMQFCGRSYLVGIGYDSEGQAREVWGDGAHQGSELDAMIDDGCILMSLLLQLSYPVRSDRAAFGERINTGSRARHRYGGSRRRFNIRRDRADRSHGRGDRRACGAWRGGWYAWPGPNIVFFPPHHRAIIRQIERDGGWRHCAAARRASA